VRQAIERVEEAVAVWKAKVRPQIGLAHPGFAGAALIFPGASRIGLPPASPSCCDKVSGG
jgi:hypothetical protein